MRFAGTRRPNVSSNRNRPPSTNIFCSHRRHYRLENLRTLVLADNNLTRLCFHMTDDSNFTVISGETDENEVSSSTIPLTYSCRTNWCPLEFFKIGVVIVYTKFINKSYAYIHVWFVCIAAIFKIRI